MIHNFTRKEGETMKYDFILTPEQRVLAEQNLSLVDKVIARYIHTNEAVCSLGWEDLRQEGYLALCRAAATYDGASAHFSTYATTLSSIPQSATSAARQTEMVSPIPSS